MNINEVTNIDCHEQLAVLKRLLGNTGNCAMNGYLGDSVSGVSITSNGNVEFSSNKKDDSTLVNSKGTVLSDSVVIKQEQTIGNRVYYQVFSWDLAEDVYTYIAFDDSESMNACYEKIKTFDVNLCREDISTKFVEMGIAFDHMAQILLNQSVHSSNSMIGETSFKNRGSSHTLQEIVQENWASLVEVICYLHMIFQEVL